MWEEMKSPVCLCIKDHAIILQIVVFQCGHADTSILVILIDKGLYYLYVTPHYLLYDS